MLDSVALLRLARQGSILLTPNFRAARQIRSRLGALAASPEESSALGERVLHWRAWTASLWQSALVEGREDRVLLDPLQERYLWEQVLQSDGTVEPTDALLDLCISAAGLVYRYDARDFLLRERSHRSSDDLARFARWFGIVDGRCAAESLLPSAALENALAAHVSSEGTGDPASQSLVLCGLADLSPAQTGLLAALKVNGNTLTNAPQAKTIGNNPVLLRCLDETDEMRALTRHLASRLAGADRPEISVVVPDLSSARDRIDRALREHLHVAQSDPLGEDRRPLWEFSVGRPLASFAIASDALHLLTWTVRDLDTTEISLLLRSAHLGWPVDAETAASIDAGLLRRHGHLTNTWSPRSTAKVVERSSPALAAALMGRTLDWPSLRHSSGSFTASVDHARQVLRNFCWFGAGNRTSTEFQASSRFLELLDNVALLDLTASGPVSWATFIERVTTAARATRFAPQNLGAPIQFLTPEESTGTEAGEAWVMHADEARWSGYTAPHPLLSWQVQQRHGMPGVDPRKDEHQFREQVERIVRMAPSAHFSFAHAGQSGEQRPCPQVVTLANLTRRNADASGLLSHLEASAELESFDDGDLIPLELADRGTPVPGGVSILQSQAACAFRAFAERRLGSTRIETHDLGLDPRDRGSLMHDALHLFWAETKDSDALHRLIADGRLGSVVHRAVSQALTRHSAHRDRWSEAYLEIQRFRLESLLSRWLQREAERPKFSVVALERDLVVTIGGLPLKVRIDRIDQVTQPDGTEAYVILDYKTGLPSAKKWEGDRPDEPQLLLYATSAMAHIAPGAEVPVGAIAFGLIRAGDELSFVSTPPRSAWLSADSKASPASLQVDLENWSRTLQTLAEDFRDGIATVGPKEYPSTCRYCDQRLLCRLNPALLTAEQATAEDES